MYVRRLKNSNPLVRESNVVWYDALTVACLLSRTVGTSGNCAVIWVRKHACTCRAEQILQTSGLIQRPALEREDEWRNTSHYVLPSYKKAVIRSLSWRSEEDSKDSFGWLIFLDHVSMCRKQFSFWWTDAETIWVPLCTTPHFRARFLILRYIVWKWTHIIKARMV